MSRLIEVIVSPQGETRLKTRGFAGAACQQATQAMEAALGLKQSETLTAEFHLASPAQEHLASSSEA